MIYGKAWSSMVSIFEFCIFENIFEKFPDDLLTIEHVCAHGYSDLYQLINHFWFLVKKEGPEQEYAMNHFVNRNQCCRQKFGKIQHQMSLEKFVKFWTIWLIFDCFSQRQHFCIKGIDRLNTGHFFYLFALLNRFWTWKARKNHLKWNQTRSNKQKSTLRKYTFLCLRGRLHVGEQISIPEFNLHTSRKLKEFKLLENIMTSIFCMRIFY